MDKEHIRPAVRRETALRFRRRALNAAWFLAVAFAAVLASPQPASAQQGPGFIIAKSGMYTGTNCNDLVIIFQGWYPVTSAQLLVNGTAVKTVLVWVGPNIEATIDSTHFGDGSTLNMEVQATDSHNNVWTRSWTEPVYNKAVILGNQAVPNGIGTLTQGIEAAGNAAQAVNSSNYTDLLAGEWVQQRASDIETDLPHGTLFYDWTHGNPSEIGDDATTNPDGVFMTTTDISAAIADPINGKQAQHEPPYSFVFADACNCGQTTAFYGAFGQSGPDAAFLGWAATIGDTQGNSAWEQTFFTDLAQGNTLSQTLKTINPSGELDVNGNPATPVVVGDAAYKLHGVYGGVGLAWYN